MRAARLLLPAALGALALAAPAPAAARRCSARGLSYRHTDANAMQTGYRIAGLRAAGTSCARARRIASIVGHEIYRDGRPHRRVLRFRIVARLPCAGCAPTVPVTAGRKHARVTFRYLGGV